MASDPDKCGPDFSETAREIAPFISALTGGNEEPMAPWLAAIGISRPNEEFTVICSGSILNRRFILTGASCFLSEQYQPSHVRVGAKHIESRFAEEREILDRELQFSGFRVISPICLPDSSLLYPVTGLGMSVHGWGQGKDASQVNVNIRSKGSLFCEKIPFPLKLNVKNPKEKRESRKNFTSDSLSSKKC